MLLYFVPIIIKGFYTNNRREKKKGGGNNMTCKLSMHADEYYIYTE